MLIVPSCKLYLPMEGNANDASGNGNNGSVIGATLVAGKFGQCYSFDGIDDYMDMGTGTIKPWDFASGVPFSISSWIYINSGGGVVFGDAGASHNNYCVTVSPTFIGLVNNYTYGYIYATIPSGTWFFYTTVWNGGIVYGYINGAYVGSTSFSNSGPLSSHQWRVGYARFPGTAQAYFNGLIDEVAIFNKALGQSDIKRVMMGLHPLG